MKRVVMLAAVVWGVSAAAASAQPRDPLYREFKDWVLACDNVGICEAKFVLDETAEKSVLLPDAPLGYLSITREPGPGGALIVATQSLADEASARFDPHAMTLDGKPVAAPWSGPDKDGGFSLDGAKAQRFIAAVGDGTLLTFDGGGRPQKVSLAGLKAALLAMDEAQGRLDTVTALVRPGARPATSVPAGPVVPTVDARPVTGELPDADNFAARVRAVARATLQQHGCDDAPPQPDRAYPLNYREALVVLDCRMAAYQGSSLLYRAPRDAPQKAQLVDLPLQPTLKPRAADERGEYVEGDWDPKSATFSESSKGRGLADCGLSTTWAFDGETFHLASFNYLERCGGGPPGDWPTLYRSELHYPTH
jgi:hypothetical protein